MNEKPTLSELSRGIAIHVLMAAAFCWWVARWWLGTDPALGGHPVLIVLVHMCAAYQVAKVGWIIYWWRRPMPIPTAGDQQNSTR